MCTHKLNDRNIPAYNIKHTSLELHFYLNKSCSYNILSTLDGIVYARVV